MERVAILIIVLGLSIIAPAIVQERQQQTRWAIAYDFVERFSESRVDGADTVQVRTDVAGGVTRTSIFQHPPLKAGAPAGRLVFDKVELPALNAGESLRLHLYIGISDRIDLKDIPTFDGCEFAVIVGGQELMRRPWAEQRWLEWSADLTEFAGRTVSIAFETGARGNSLADWALWGEPRIEIVGRPWKPKEGPQTPALQFDRLEREPMASRTFRQKTETYGSSVVAVMDPYLDLPYELAEWSGRLPPPEVPLPPVIVVGEGPDAQNHTLVRVLSHYGIAEQQFLAYPPSVRGGVAVSAGCTASGQPRVIAAPLEDSTIREVRVFDLNGIQTASIQPPANLRPPYAIEAGQFIRGKRGDEVAVISGERGGLYDMAGRLLVSFRIPGARGRGTILSRVPAGGTHDLLVYQRGEGSARVYRFTVGDCRQVREIAVRFPEGSKQADGVYPSAFGNRSYVTGPHSERSQVRLIAGKTDATADLGAYENLFWYQWYRPLGEGKHVRRSDFAHLRTDHSTSANANPSLAARPENWSEKAIVARYGTDGGFAGYLTDRPKLWEPCFTHRQPKVVFESWLKDRDGATGLPMYPMLTRSGRPVEYGEFGNIDFYASTYAFGLPAIDNMYILPLRAFLRKLAVPFRQQPERCAGLEPNHEHEIAVEADGSMGDYNLRMVTGFYDYLRRMHGTTRDGLNASMGTAFTEYFDAPRNWERGRWDAYDPANPFYKNWTDYNRYVVSRRVAETFREALLAGFPPEIIKCHQIPDTYAVGNLQAFSDVTARFTPIDWMLNAGTGFGFTRYGVWYNRPHDALQDAHSSGFDAISIGEYQALTPDARSAYEQLRFLFENGCVSAHCMLWPEGHDRGYNDTMHQALERLVADDKPRPGLTGGVGRIRPAQIGGRRCDIACIGTGTEHTGLLKSLNEDGSWHGGVYVVPFHAHVDVALVANRPRATLARGRTIVIGPLAALDSGEQIEMVTRASSAGGRGILRFTVLRDGRPLPGLTHDIKVGNSLRPARYVLRNQLPTDGISIRLEAINANVELRDLAAYRESEQTTKLTKGKFGGERHRGAVTFDVVSTPQEIGSQRTTPGGGTAPLR